MQGKRERNLGFDILRILSAFSVVMLHVSAAFIGRFEVGSVDFRLANFMNSISRYGVPIFVMISGAIFLSEEREITVKKLWTKNIFRMLIVFGVWSFAYYVYQSLYYWNFDFWRQGIVRTITGCVYASDHFWFIFMIIGLYALVPFIRSFVHHASKKELDYFVILFMVFQIGRTTLTTLVDKSLVGKLSDMFTIVELSWYLGYFVLGYILVKYGVSAKVKYFLYGSVPLGIVANYFISDYMSTKQGVYSPGIYDSFGVFTFLHAVALFVFVTDLFGKKQMGAGVSKLCSNLALDTLGIYVMHVGLLDFFRSKEFLFGSVGTIPGILLLTLICFVVCAVIAALLRRIPLLGKYIC
ncbi:MAG: acyltransferase family protein [Lachnospiraceae bacterium]|nr:acyltransferase family protein [Lachnospiraceae bacterium]